MNDLYEKLKAFESTNLSDLEFQSLTLTVTRDTNGTHYGVSITDDQGVTQSYNKREPAKR